MIVNDNPYLPLGVGPSINCCGVRTPYGGNEGSTISYPADGEVGGDRMSGTTWPGAASAHSGRSVDPSRFGAGSWRAQRLA